MELDSPFEEHAAISAMDDPHIVYLRYRLIPTDDAVEFSAPSVELETCDWKLYVGPLENARLGGPIAHVSSSLADDSSDEGALRVRNDVEAVFTFKRRYRSEQEAFESVRPFLEAWQLDEALAEPGQPPRYTFELAGSLAVDVNPPPGEEAQYAVQGSGSFYVRPPEQEIVVAKFRPPPTDFAVDDHVRTLWLRWRRYVNGEDTLGAAAYACLTYLEAEFGPGRKEAETRLRISGDVFDNVGRIVSAVGDASTARKFGPAPRRSHTPEEVEFVEAAVTRMLRRVAELAAAGDPGALPRVEMRDLPGL